jgi:hypothetical protein
VDWFLVFAYTGFNDGTPVSEQTRRGPQRLRRPGKPDAMARLKPELCVPMVRLKPDSTYMVRMKPDSTYKVPGCAAACVSRSRDFP